MLGLALQAGTCGWGRRRSPPLRRVRCGAACSASSPPSSPGAAAAGSWPARSSDCRLNSICGLLLPLLCDGLRPCGSYTVILHPLVQVRDAGTLSGLGMNFPAVLRRQRQRRLGSPAPRGPTLGPRARLRRRRRGSRRPPQQRAPRTPATAASWTTSAARRGAAMPTAAAAPCSSSSSSSSSSLQM